MAKKSKYGWVFVGNTPAGRTQKPTDFVKREVNNSMKPLIEKLKEKSLKPIPEPHERNHLINIYGKWYRNFYYIYQTFKCPPEGYNKEKFDMGLVRMRYVGDEKFDLAYFRHTGEWWDLPSSNNLTITEAINAIETEPWFQIF